MLIIEADNVDGGISTQCLGIRSRTAQRIYTIYILTKPRDGPDEEGWRGGRGGEEGMAPGFKRAKLA
jgi:hypothetical protein